MAGLRDIQPILMNPRPILWRIIRSLKVPCLITDDGLLLFGSQLICEYLDSLGDELPLFPERGAPRWRALKFQSLGDGILDAAVPCRGELGKPKEEARDAQIARYMSAISRTVDVLEAD